MTAEPTKLQNTSEDPNTEVLPHISPNEWHVMSVVWESHPISASQVSTQLVEDGHVWDPKTVNTYLGRLKRKGAIQPEKRGRTYFYHPLVSQQSCLRARCQEFVESTFKGSWMTMVHFLLKQGFLKAADLRSALS